MIWKPWALSMLPRLGTLRHMSGTYSSWDAANSKCNGYADPAILEACLTSAREVYSGRAAWERDSVLLPKVDYSWPVIAELLRVQSLHGQLSVVDYGGGFGSSYVQFKHFSGGDTPLKWTVVEQANIAAAGAGEFNTNELMFASDIRDAFVSKGTVVLLSSVLQYLHDPEATIASLEKLTPDSIIIDRTPILNKQNGLFSVQHVPGRIYKATYPIRVFSSTDISSMFKNWSLVAEFPSYCDSPKKLFRGRIYRCKHSLSPAP